MATPNIIPRGNEEGNLGLLNRIWLKIWAKSIFVSGEITDGTNSVTVAELMSSSDEEFTNVITPAILTATADNYEPTGWETSHLVRQDINANNREISGLKAPDPKRYIVKRINNISLINDLRFLHNDGGSDEDNKFLLRDNGDRAIRPNETAEFYYDVIQSKWKPKNRIG